MAKSTADTSDFAREKKALIAERTAQGLSGDVSDEEVCIYAERRYRDKERRLAFERLKRDVCTLIRRNEREFQQSAMDDLNEQLERCSDDVERIRVCYRYIGMYAGLKNV